MAVLLSQEIVRRDQFAELCNRRGLLKHAVEIGTEKAGFATRFLETWQGDQLLCIDPWRNELPGYPEMHWDRAPDFHVAMHALVDALAGRVHFVQCGEQGHWHPPLQRVTRLVGKTSLREFIRLVYHADGVLCPVTLAMHLAAALPAKPGGPKRRPCVVVAGGREPTHWEAYPHHQFLHTVGSLPCCAQGGCWKSRCQRVGDGDPKDRHNRCERPVRVSDDLEIPACMALITPGDVVRRIELYYEGGACRDAPADAS